MTTTWVLVAHRAGARLFENRGPGRGLTLLRELSHAAGRLHDRDVESDKPGRAFERYGVQRHHVSREESPREHAVHRFTHELGTMLNTARAHNEFDRLVLVADPRVLGKIREAIDAQTTGKIKGTLDKDLAHVDEKQLPHHLGEVMAV